MRYASYAPSCLALVAGLTLALGTSPALASHYAVGDIPSLISAADAAKLAKAGISTTEELLHKAAKAKDRQSLAKASGLSATAVMGLARRCDLLRIKGIGPEMVLLLEAAGVKTSGELSKKEPAALTAATDQANKAKHITEKPPTEPQFQEWIEQAKNLPPVLDAK